MKRFLSVFLAVLSTVSIAFAQQPLSVRTDGNYIAPGRARMQCLNEAGTIANFGPFSGQSNDLTPDTLYLCLGDSVFVNHAGNYNFQSDPNGNTPAGISYIFYTEPPTVAGTNLATVRTDPSLLPNPDPTGVGFFAAPSLTNANNIGDIWFFNDGFLQSNFNGGNPFLLWFAPATYDRLNANGEPVYEPEDPNDPGSPVGPCVDVSIEEAFAVVYLNEISVTNPQNGANCQGSFQIAGGLPEFAGGSYAIDISLASDPSVKGSITNGSANHNDVVEFTVPQSGDYLITVEDGKSCGASAMITMNACNAVTFQLPFRNALPGQSICVPVTVENFTNIANFQFTVSWDASILSFTNVQNFSPSLPDLTVNNTNQTNNDLGVAWFDLATTGNDLADGEVLFEICFTVTGLLGECAPIEFNGSEVEIQVGDSQDEPVGFILENGKVCVSNAPFFTDLVPQSPTCADDTDGSFTVQVGQGIAPFSYRWRRIPPTGPYNGPIIINEDNGSSTVTGLSNGFYEVIISDSADPINTIVDTVEIEPGTFLGLSLLEREPSCFGDTDGAINTQITLDGFIVGDPIAEGYVFQWSNTTANVDSITGLAAGQTYSLTVTEPANGCSSTASLTLGGPARINVLPNDPDVAVTDATCSGSADGSITVQANGGAPFAGGQYRFTWDDNSSIQGTEATLFDLDPGPYSVTVTDRNGCTATSNFTVDANKILGINAVVDDVNCFGGEDGRIFITGTTTFNIPNGTPDLPYTFVWSNNAPTPTTTQTTSEIDQLLADTYFVTMTDAVGCEIIDSFTVAQPPQLAIDIQTTDETCDIGMNGTATLTVAGGDYPYTYLWSHDPTLADSIATGLSAADDYSVTITDANGCEEILTYTIDAPVPPIVQGFDITNVSCPEDTDGSITIDVVAGSGTLSSIQWSTGGVGGPENTTISNLAPATYYVTITQSNQCVTIDSATVVSPGPIVLDSVDIQTPSCVGFSDGRITVFPSGGTPPYTFTWSTAPNTPGTINPLSALAAGTYSVTITDANNCTPLVQEIVVPDPPSIVGNFGNLIAVSCPDDVTCDGQATFAAEYSNGETGVFNFTWSNGFSEVDVPSSTNTGLCRGPVTVTVSDGVCGAEFSTEIDSPDSILIQTAIQPVSCFGLMDGTINLTPSGGTPPFTYFWVETQEDEANIENLPAGTYTAIISDFNGCVRQQIIEVPQPAELILEIDPTVTTPSVSCFGDTDGVIGVRYDDQNTNPLGDMPYTWSGGVGGPNDPVARDLAPGDYGITLTDSKGCQDSLTYTIGEPSPILFNVLPIEEPLCFGESTNVIIESASGGQGNGPEDYSFSVNNDGFQIPISQPGRTFAGETVVTVFDSVGCFASDTFFVNQPPEIVIDLPEMITIELGDSTQQLNPQITPAGDIYDYEWTATGDGLSYLSSDSVRAPFIYPFTSEDYTILATNQNGCSALANIFVEVDANRNVYIPNAFSPDFNGRNDEFRVFACLGVVSISKVGIFDRWGGEVFISDSVIEPDCLDGTRLWDGFRDGQAVNPGVYVYVVEVNFLDGETLIYRGDVTVVR